MATTRALVTPEVMRWSREQMGLSLDEAARKIGRPVADIDGWERGTLKPSIAQARKASEVYKRPLATFYLPQPPSDFATLRDFRSLPASVSRRYSPELALLIRTSAYRQKWLREYLGREGAKPLSFIGSATMVDAASDIAARIRIMLEIDQSEIKKSRGRAGALSLWIRKIEDIGIFVFKTSKVALKEARGFALSDDLAPIVCINTKDAKAAQIFTLAHELAHIWLGHRAISNLVLRGQVLDPEVRDIEVLCNQIASETILAPSDFQSEWQKLMHLVEEERKIEQLSQVFKVSEEVIARRMLQEQIIDQQYYERLRARYQQRWKDEGLTKANGDAPIYFPMTAAQNGRMFTRMIIGGFNDGSIAGREASELLNVKINNFSKLGEHVGLPKKVLS